MNFEEKMKRLQEISDIMDEGKLSLDDAIKMYEEGMKLAKDCTDTINNTKGKILEIKTQLDGKTKEENMDNE